MKDIQVTFHHFENDDEKQRALDANIENESKTDFGPMVQITLK